MKAKTPAKKQPKLENVTPYTIETYRRVAYGLLDNLFLRRCDGSESPIVGLVVQPGETVADAFRRSLKPGEAIVYVSPEEQKSREYKRKIAERNAAANDADATETEDE
ncbi:MAG TPA: hypothetical protein VHK27_05515 [Gammaproteobacteria bacterium]|nr:hypothetical protein [Gammaproteobacteria bacterium]